MPPEGANGVADSSPAFRITEVPSEESRALRYFGLVVAFIAPILIAVVFLLDRIDAKVDGGVAKVETVHNRDNDRIEKRLEKMDGKLDRLLERKP